MCGSVTAQFKRPFDSPLPRRCFYEPEAMPVLLYNPPVSAAAGGEGGWGAAGGASAAVVVVRGNPCSCAACGAAHSLEPPLAAQAVEAVPGMLLFHHCARRAQVVEAYEAFRDELLRPQVPL